MRRTGIILTLLALVAVQAPWIACGCEDDESVAPTLLGVFGLADDGVPCECHGLHRHAHAHGHDHGHSHCTEHEDPDNPDPVGHVGFRLPIATMPAALDLDAPLCAFAPLLADLGGWEVLPEHAVAVALAVGPPGGSGVPSAATERLLL